MTVTNIACNVRVVTIMCFVKGNVSIQEFMNLSSRNYCKDAESLKLYIFFFFCSKQCRVNGLTSFYDFTLLEVTSLSHYRESRHNKMQ